MKTYEVGGKVYESIISSILDTEGIKYKWDVKLDGVFVKSDFVLYKNNIPSHVILVTHSTSESGTNMKFWRNIEELFELKAAYPGIVVSSILFPGKWKDGLKDILINVFDGSLDLDNKIYTERLNDHLNKIIRSSKKVAADKVVENINIYKKENNDFLKIYNKIKLDFKKNIINSTFKKDLFNLWENERIRSENEINSKQITFSLKNTYYKSGLIKLSFFNAEERQEIYDLIINKNKISKSLEDRIVGLKLAEVRKSIKGSALILDQSILYTVNKLGSNKIETIISNIVQKYGSQIQDYLDPIINSANIKIDISTSIQEILHLEKAGAIEKISELIVQSYSKGQRNKFFSTCIFLCKFADPKFSFDVIVREGAINRGSGLQRFADIDSMLIGNKIASNDVINKLSAVLLKRIKEIDISKIEINYDEFIASIAKQTYVTLIKHRSINFLKELVRLRLVENGWLVLNENIKYRSCLSEYSQASKNVGDPIFTFLLSRDNKKVLCHVISAYASTHKHKECPGKVRVSRYKYLENNGHKDFVSRNLNESFLVLDGTWEELFGDPKKAIGAFIASGWSSIIDVENLLIGDLPSLKSSKN